MTKFRLIIAAFMLLMTLGWGSIVAVEANPEPISDIIFSHAFHVVEQEVECLACHAPIEESAAAGDRNLPEMDVCGDCHDVDDDDECGSCHRNPEEPEAAPEAERTIVFSHQNHLGRSLDCQNCHAAEEGGKLSGEQEVPAMVACMGCHDGEQADNACELCHTEPITLADIHPADWRHYHGERASSDADWCGSCHQREADCRQCHQGDNLRGQIHDLNYRFTHGLDAQSKVIDCNKCHDSREFCNDCHVRELRMPLNHSRGAWRGDHGMTARQDVENCAACHDSADPTCARVACHADHDGLLGTDPSIHSSGLGRFDAYGPWHSDEGYFCYQCHLSTEQAGIGFCGYCHGAVEEGGR